MASVCAREGGHKWWICGVAAVLVHSAAASALPDAARLMASARPSAPPALWLSVLATPTLSDEAPVVADKASSARSAPRQRRVGARAAEASHSQRSTHTQVGAALTPAGAASAPMVSASAPVANAAATGLGAAGPSAQAASVAQAASAQAASAQAASGGDQGLAVTASHGPGLLPVRNPCGGYFPASARVDHGQVRVHVQVDEAGRVSVARVLTELPHGQDFGDAARACAAALRFAPAVDSRGMPVTGNAKLELSFHRS